MQTEELIQQLIEQTRQIMNQAEGLKTKDMSYLTWRKDPESWNILECIEHLNRYGDFYLVEMENAIEKSATQKDSHFKSGMLGNYFAQSMLPKEKLNKMKTFKDKNPLNANLEKSVLDTFFKQQLQLIELLNKSMKVSLNKVKIKTSISSLIKMKLGDTFQFYINHMLRHLKQIERIEQTMPKPVTR